MGRDAARGRLPRSEVAEAARIGLRLALGVCFAAAFATPFVVAYDAWDDAYHTPKRAWLAHWAVVASATLLALRALGPERVAPTAASRLGCLRASPLLPLHLGVFGPLALSLASVLWARSPSLALERAEHLAAAVAFFAVALAGASRRTAARRLAFGAAALVVVSTATALWTLEQDFVRAFLPERVRLVSNLSDWRGFLAAGLGNTNHIGDLLALGLLATVSLLAVARRRGLVVALSFASALQAAALIVCYSVGSNLGLIAGAGAMLVLALARSGPRYFLRRPRRWIATLAAWGAVVAFYNVDTPANPHRPGILANGFGSERWREGGPTRLVIWAGALEIVRENPWLGVGAGNFTYVFPTIRSPFVAGDPDLARYAGMWTNAAHNNVLQLWSELGIGGVALWAIAVLAAFDSLLRGLRRASPLGFLARLTLAGLLVATLAHGTMNFTLQHPTGLLTFHLILAAVAIERAGRGRPKAEGIAEGDEGSGLVPTPAGASGPGAARLAGACVLLAAAIASGWWFRRPILAQSEYREAHRALAVGAPFAVEDAHLRRAVELDPRGTGARSHRARRLLERAEDTGDLALHVEALVELDRVRERLDSAELLERESRALAGLGRMDEARAVWKRYLERVGRAE